LDKRWLVHSAMPSTPNPCAILSSVGSEVEGKASTIPVVPTGGNDNVASSTSSSSHPRSGGGIMELCLGSNTDTSQEAWSKGAGHSSLRSKIIQSNPIQSIQSNPIHLFHLQPIQRRMNTRGWLGEGWQWVDQRMVRAVGRRSACYSRQRCSKARVAPTYHPPRTSKGG